jgi:hypothetical protein
MKKSGTPKAIGVVPLALVEAAGLRIDKVSPRYRDRRYGRDACTCPFGSGFLFLAYPFSGDIF